MFYFFSFSFNLFYLNFKIFWKFFFCSKEFEFFLYRLWDFFMIILVILFVISWGCNEYRFFNIVFIELFFLIIDL